MASEQKESVVDAKSATTVERFLALRKLSLPKKPQKSAPTLKTSPTKVVGGAAAAGASQVWTRYSKRIHGERVTSLRAAMRIPDDGYIDSRDAYNPKKPPKRFIKLHAEEQQISADFHVHTRAMFFERAQVDREVCDRLANREWYDTRLKQLYSHDYGDGGLVRNHDSTSIQSTAARNSDTR